MMGAQGIEAAEIWLILVFFTNATNTAQKYMVFGGNKCNRVSSEHILVFILN